MGRFSRLWSSALLALSVCGLGSGAIAKKAEPEGFQAIHGDTLVHRASGYRFPRKLAGFTRTSIFAFDLTGHDFAVTYQKALDGKPVIARIAMIHIVAMTPKEHYLGLKGVVGTYFQDQSFSDIKPAGEGPFTPPGLPADSGYQGRFGATLDRTPYELSLSTLKLGYWDVRLTAAYPSAVAAQAQQDVMTLATELQSGNPKPDRH